MEDTKRKMNVSTCPYCFLEVDNIENLLAHMQGKHDFPFDITEESFIERSKKVGWNVDF